MNSSSISLHSTPKTNDLSVKKYKQQPVQISHPRPIRVSSVSKIQKVQHGHQIPEKETQTDWSHRMHNFIITIISTIL